MTPAASLGPAVVAFVEDQGYTISAQMRAVLRRLFEVRDDGGWRYPTPHIAPGTE